MQRGPDVSQRDFKTAPIYFLNGSMSYKSIHDLKKKKKSSLKQVQSLCTLHMILKNFYFQG